MIEPKMVMTKIQDKELGFGTVEPRQRRLMTKEGNYNYIRYGLALNETFQSILKNIPL